MCQFLKAQSLTTEQELEGEEPKLATLLFLGYFGGVDHVSSLDTFRFLKVFPKSIKVINAELTIDGNGKTVINFELKVGYT